jgi:hypothetical protein
MTTKYTPGPWDIRFVDDLDFMADITANKQPICAVYAEGLSPEATANARLIAAAPELVEALRGLMTLEIIATNSDEWERINNARALLARIDGEQA